MRASAPLLIFCAVLAACTAEDVPRPEPIVIYAPGEAGAELADLVNEFTEDTGIRASIRWGSSADLTDSVIGKTGVPADILLTDNLADIWRAADEGALRPISSALPYRSAEQLRDADGYWGAFNFRMHMIVANKEATPLIGSLEQLAEPAMSGRVCLTSSALADNRALIAMLIDARGVRDAERLIRRIAANSNKEPFQSVAKLKEALREGRCDYGIVATSKPTEDLAHFVVPANIYSADAFGIGRHARNPESAQLFAGWMFETHAMRPEGDAEWPHASVAGYRDEEARLLAERAGYR